MESVNKLEKALGDIFEKSAPKLPDSAKKTIVEWLPWINLILGVVSLWAVYGLWSWANTVNKWSDYANNLSATFGGPKVVDDRLSIMVWLSLVVLAIQAVIYIMAFPATRDKKKSGWNLMFYAVLINAVYGVVSLFTDYGGAGNLVGYLIGTVIGLYFLFQIRGLYMGGGNSSPTS